MYHLYICNIYRCASDGWQWSRVTWCAQGAIITRNPSHAYERAIDEQSGKEDTTEITKAILMVRRVVLTDLLDIVQKSRVQRSLEGGYVCVQDPNLVSDKIKWLLAFPCTCMYLRWIFSYANREAWS